VNVYLCPECYHVVAHVPAGWPSNRPPGNACMHRLSTYREITIEQAETAMLYTLGYGDRKPPMMLMDLRYILRQEQIGFVVDVRRNPISHKAGFSKTLLSAFLEANSIGYWHCPALGASKELRRDLRATGDYGMFFYAFLGYLRSDRNAEAALRSVAALVADRQRLALLCTEADHERCHRQVVAEEVHRLLAAKPGLRHL
jgi:uncharacterized protein (DUF488 family)